MKIKLPKNYELTGPYNEYSAPYGKVVPSLNRKVWFLTRNDIPMSEFNKDMKGKPKEFATLYRKFIKKYGYSKCLGEIERFDNQLRRFILPQTYPIIEFSNLQRTVDYLIDNEGKIVYCT